MRVVFKNAFLNGNKHLVCISPNVIGTFVFTFLNVVKKDEKKEDQGRHSKLLMLMQYFATQLR